MRFAVAAFVAGAAVASANPQYGYGSNSTTPSSYVAPPVYTTSVVTAYETYCPEPTQLTYNGVTYTVTEATTLTITNCPCTVTAPVYSSVVTSSCTTTATPPPYYPSSNGTVAPPPPATGSYTPPAVTSPVTPPPGYTGAASKASFGVAGLLAAAGLVAAL